MQTIARSSTLSLALLILIALSTLVFRLGALPFVGADEPRYARIAQEMQESGAWVTPTLEHRPWLEKPPLYYWITIPFYSLFGVSETTARLGPVLFMLMMALSVFWFGSRIRGNLAGLLGAVILLTSIGVVAFGRSASTDMPLSACLTVALSILGSALLEDRTPAWRLWVGYAFLGLAILGKGPVALLLAIGIGTAFWCLDERGGSLRSWRIGTGLAVILAVALPWFVLAFRENGFAFVAIFLVNHNIARYISDIHHHTEPFYYFLPVLPALMFPWCAWLPLLLPASMRDTLRRWREWDRTTLYLMCWAIVPLVFFSASRSKLPGYILPSIPPIALLLGVAVAGWDEGREPWSGARAAAWVQLGLSLAVAVAFPIVLTRNYGGGLRGGLVISGICLISGLLSFRHLYAGRPMAGFRITAAQGVLLVLALSQFAFPAIGRYTSAKEIAAKITNSREAGEPAVTFRFFHHALHYYAVYTLTEDFGDLPALETFSRTVPHFLVVVESEHEQELRNLPSCSISVLGEQGKLRLLRLTCNK